MKVTVTTENCSGHGLCTDACPSVFSLGDGDDVVSLLEAHPDESLRHEVLAAERACPAGAISVEG